MRDRLIEQKKRYEAAAATRGAQVAAFSALKIATANIK
jgi:hypothetical protein